MVYVLGVHLDWLEEIEDGPEAIGFSLKSGIRRMMRQRLKKQLEPLHSHNAGWKASSK